jgi:hypothetical protein
MRRKGMVVGQSNREVNININMGNEPLGVKMEI